MLKFKKTKINSMYVDSFRNLNDLNIELGEYITLIAGRNGTSKSTILGSLAQICSFEKNYTPNGEQEPKEEDLTKYTTFYGSGFSSEFTDHFRISKKYDSPKNKYSIKFEIEDAQEELLINSTLAGTRRSGALRLVHRKKESIIPNTSRNITHPTVFLGLERLLPISKRDLKIIEEDELNTEEVEFLKRSTRTVFTSHYDFEQISTNTTSTGPDSTVVTGRDYDVSSASSGEDNLGQILMFLISLKRLKKQWKNYKGGIYLIDEIDASLFPRAQIELYKLLYKQAKELDLQVIFTTHSPTLISYCIERIEQEKRNISTADKTKLNFLSAATGRVRNNTDYSLSDIIADLNLETVDQNQVFKVNCYIEDNEAYQMAFRLLTNEQKKKIKFMKNITMGSENYINLAKNKIPEFSRNSLVILDGDKSKQDKYNNIINLPGNMAPDQLIYHYLINLDHGDSYWVNDIRFTKDVFNAQHTVSNIKDKTEYNEEKNCYQLKTGNSEKAARDYFKKWFNQFQTEFFNKKGLNPFIKFKKEVLGNEELESFREDFDQAYLSVFKNTAYFN